MMPGFGWHNCCGFGGFGNLGWIGWIVNIALTVGILIALVLLVVWAIRRMSDNQQNTVFSTSQGRERSSARDVLQTRYARGEITREEYRQMLEDIR